ncbi:tannase/feruloyl esterase family alpha/beta hydrolase [Paraburkholderia sp. MM5384-R2]|uniref:tannase/feruloyl esterase family alpha/beta hydrolase n=1 Tax=Paraburkholderia sp. MM5384-R2 TaxID=2723097 RepID=UPI0017FD158C|nr:tannase/feruloyl esterase family alpha/beta hydrolase [Paraburkholderia sp. MM5384-R2]MBB5497521.1 hypothetical protein [Paraburkholderia sp. MM5384-R2]
MPVPILQLGTARPAPVASPPSVLDVLTMPFPYIFWDEWIKYFVTRDPSFNTLSFDPANPGSFRQRIAYLSRIQDINSTDLSAFARRGGKLLIAHGAADGIASTRSTEDYYGRLVRRYGEKKTRNFARCYEVPGFGHTSGAFSPAWDSLTALENWMEHGVTPTNQIISDINPATLGRTRPLCEYPTWPRYTGKGDPNVAASFTCVTSRSKLGLSSRAMWREIARGVAH